MLTEVKTMAIEFRTGFLGFNKDDVLNYVHLKDRELKTLSAELNAKIAELEKRLDRLKEEHLSDISTIEKLSKENTELNIKASEYDRKTAEIDAMSANIGKLYLVSKSTAKTIVADAEESSRIVSAQTDKSIDNIEQTQASLKELAEEILSASQSFVSRIGEFNRTLEDAKSKIDENKSNSSAVSEEFAELYAKL